MTPKTGGPSSMKIPRKKPSPQSPYRDSTFSAGAGKMPPLPPGMTDQVGHGQTMSRLPLPIQGGIAPQVDATDWMAQGSASMPRTMQHPMAMTPGNGFQDINDLATRIAMQSHGDVGGMPQGAMPNQGFAQGVSGQMGMNPTLPRQPMPMGSIQGAMPNMGMAQGNADNYFPESRLNSPFGRGVSSLSSKPIPSDVKIPGRSKTRSPGIALDGSRIKY